MGREWTRLMANQTSSTQDAQFDTNTSPRFGLQGISSFTFLLLHTHVNGVVRPCQFHLPPAFSRDIVDWYPIETQNEQGQTTKSCGNKMTDCIVNWGDGHLHVCMIRP